MLPDLNRRFTSGGNKCQTRLRRSRQTFLHGRAYLKGRKEVTPAGRRPPRQQYVQSFAGSVHGDAIAAFAALHNHGSTPIHAGHR